MNLIEELDGYKVKFKQKKPEEGFRYPVFLDEESKIYYYVIEKPTYIMKDKVEYTFKQTEEPDNGIEYVAIAKDMMDKFAKSLDAEKLFMMLKGPELNYVKGYIFDLRQWQKKGGDELDIYIGDYISNRNHNFKSHMFLTSKMTYIKQEEIEKN
tara:strand:- start:347 stop:808 length:462 start_codon:yes stop_codon:yes gene_type:complete